MNEAEYQELMATSWQRRLTPDEEARLYDWLAAHPEHRAGWEADCGLDRLLGQLPNVPVSSNFTARALYAAQREADRAARRPFLLDLWQRLFPRPAAGIAWAAVMLCLGWLATEQVANNSRRNRADEFATLYRAAAASDLSLLQDFDAIQRLPQPEDEELFAVLTHSAVTQ